jgi:CheY-like chemotaxis protein
MPIYDPIAHESKTILLIEDNIDDERLTLRALRKHNVMNEVVVACDGQEAMDFLAGTGKFAGRPKLDLPAFVMLDIKLPGMSGLEVLQKIRENADTKHTPVIVLTASQDTNLIQSAYLAGANSYVLKPTDPVEYGEMVLQLVMYWLLLNRSSE